MKRKLYSLFLAIVMLFSLGLNVFAEESHTTDITYIGDGTEWYKLTVPAELAPGETDTVILEGTWASDRTVIVTADETVDLSNNLNNNIKTLDINFNSIQQPGDNYNEIYTTEDISVANIEGALFGNWSGTFYYNVGFEKKSVSSYASTFADNSWSDIIDAVQNDAVPSTWAVGDTKPMTINSVDYNVQIIGKDHDSYSDGSGTAPLTFQLVEIYTEARMDSSGYNSMGWSGSEMRTTTLSTVLSAMPSEVQNAIKPVDKQTLNGARSGLETTSDKLFLLSEIEVLGSTSYSKGYSEGSCYAYYANGGARIKNFNGSATCWWLRSPYYDNYTGFTSVAINGNHNLTVASGSYGVSFGFCF